MQTKQIYYQNSYQKELECKVISVEPAGNLQNVIVDQTIFYPEGGGQPCDRGMLGEAKVEYVRFSNGEIIHQVKGIINPEITVKGILDWDWRYKYMKIHTAGHLLHDVLMTLVSNLVPLKGSHGKKAFLEYQGNFDISKKTEIETKVNEILNHDLPIVTKETTFTELEKDCKFLPPNLPKNKPLRMIKIGDYPSMPDGGIHVKSTKEIGKIWIANLTSGGGIVNIRYSVV